MNKSFYLLLVLLAASAGCQPDKYIQGQRIYKQLCSNCHMDDGQGLGQLYPDISKSVYLYGKKGELVCLIKNGKQSSHLSTVEMPAHHSLREAELSNLINYLDHQWGDHSVMPIDEIRKQLESCPTY